MWIIQPLDEVWPKMKAKCAFGDKEVSGELDPVPGSLYDSERLPYTRTPQELVFFQRSVSQHFAYSNSAKGRVNTNMNQCGFVGTPEHFAMMGLAAYMDTAINERERKHLLERGRWRFSSGNRIVFEGSLADIVRTLPERQEGRWACAFCDENMVREQAVRNTLEWLKGKCEPLTVGERFFLIQPQVSFNFNLSWPEGAPEISDHVDIWIEIVGIRYTWAG